MTGPGSGRVRADFERFVISAGDRLLRTAYLITQDQAEAEDLAQDTLVRVAKRWPRVSRMQHPEAYARQVLVNLARDGAVRRARRSSELDPSGAPPPEVRLGLSAADGSGTFERRRELIEALRALTPRQRTVVVLRYFEDLSEAQVAEMLDCSVGTVKSTTSRALAQIREALEATGVDRVTQTNPLADKERQR